LDRFIVGTGRCGSTLLSRMLAEYPPALSVFEYFNGLDAARRFGAEEIEGAGFAELIGAEQPFVTAVLRRGYAVAEITYPFAGEGGAHEGRFGRSDPLPWILVSMLPRLSDDPDRLYAAATAFARARPAAPVIAHHRALFDWLCERLGKELWIERSGSSIDYLGALRDVFREGRFVHIHRDGREAALSMREHHAYRLPISLMYGAPTDAGTSAADLGPLDLRAAPSGDDAISQVLSSRPSPVYFGRYWNDQIERGDTARRTLDPEHYCDVRFEDLIADPRSVLERVARLFELDPDLDGWRDRAAALVQGAPAARLPGLAAAERQALDEACRPGLSLLGRA
jgi:hypothetical protein